MEVYWRDAGRTLLDWWRPKQEAGDEVHPASQGNAENTDETVQEDGTLALEKLDGRRVGVTPPLLATISLILLSGVLFLVSRKRQFALSDSPKLSSPTLSFPELSTTELSAPEFSTPELTSPELTSPELSPPELGATELSPPELASPELRPPETNSPELSPPEMTSRELSAPELSPPEESAPELSAPELSPPELIPPELSPPELSPPELTAHTLGSPELSSPNLSSHNERTPLPVSDDIIRRSLDDLEEERRTMNDTWFSSGDSIKEAFQKYFMPPLDDGQSSTRDPLTTIKDHVSKMQKCEFPSNSSEEVRKGFLQQVQLLHSICRLVTLRLRELQWFEETGRRHESYRPFFEHEGSYSNFYSEDSRSAPAFEDPDSNSGGENPGIPSLYGAEELLVSMGMFGLPRTQEVDKAVAYELIFQLVIEKRINIGNLEARHLFESFLQPSASDDTFKNIPSSAKHKIPYNGQQFRTGTLAQAALRIFRQNAERSSYAKVRKVYECVGNWTPEGLTKAIQQLEEENKHTFEQDVLTKNEQMRVLHKKGIQKDDLEMIVLFLL